MQTVHNDVEAEGFLGRLEVACAPKGWDSGNVVQLVVAVPFLGFFALVPAAPITMWLGYEPPLQEQPVFYVVLAAFLGLFVWGVVAIENAAQRQVLAAHEKGMRYGKKAIRYDEIATIHDGIPASKSIPTFEKLIAAKNPSVRAARNAAFTIETIDGKRVVLKMATNRYDSESLQQVVARARRHVASANARTSV